MSLPKQAVGWFPPRFGISLRTFARREEGLARQTRDRPTELSCTLVLYFLYMSYTHSRTAAVTLASI